MKTFLTLILLTTSYVANAEILTKSERKQISRYLDDICPDTYCGGDINWTSPEVVCNDGYCSVLINATSYYALEPFFSVKHFNTASSDSKKGQGYKLLSAESFMDEHHEYNRETRDYDVTQVQNTRVKAWCRLDLPSSIKTLSYEEKEEAIYDANLDCVDKIEAAIYGL